MKSYFRYPGAKTKLLPIIKPIIEDKMQDAGTKIFMDAFVGGGSVILSMAENEDLSFIINDLDDWIYCHWNIVVNGSTRELNELFYLIKKRPTIELFNKLREDKSSDHIYMAYKAIFFNRTCFSGILSSGPIGGMDQRSKYKIDCRYNANKIIDGIKKANRLLVARTIVLNMDSFDGGLYKNYENAVVYADPPYYEKGNSLYRLKVTKEMHMNLEKIMNKNMIISYDNHKDIVDLYKNHDILYVDAKYSIDGKKKGWKNAKEVVII